MHLASFTIANGGRKTIGAFVGHCYIDLHALTGGQLPADMLAFLQLGDTGMHAARAALKQLDAKLDPTGLAKLRGPVDAFFDKVTVNADNAMLRRNRLRLLARIRSDAHVVADLGRIEG